MNLDGLDHRQGVRYPDLAQRGAIAVASLDHRFRRVGHAVALVAGLGLGVLVVIRAAGAMRGAWAGSPREARIG
jgi:hypothetical protein